MVLCINDFDEEARMGCISVVDTIEFVFVVVVKEEDGSGW